MRTMHLFAGAGGGLLADLILGHTPIIAVEWDSYACQVLRERAAEGWFPELQVFEGDVRLFYPSDYEGVVDCIHAGFPCQDISVAGNQAGVGAETRSGLYREVLRIARILRPRFLYLENVSAIVSNGLGTVVADLAALGYDVEWLCLRASDCGAPHHRDRWWLLAKQACMADAEHAGQPACAGKHRGTEQHAGRAEKQGCAVKPARSNTQPGLSDDVADIDSAQRQGMRNAGGNERNGLSGSCVKEGQTLPHADKPQFKGNECTERSWQEYPDIGGGSWWETEPDVGRVVNGVAFRIHRLKALGNGQVPLQAAVAWKLLGGL